MRSMAVKFFGRYGSKSLNLASHGLLRMSSTDDPCTPKSEPCPQPGKPKEPCPPKVEISTPPPPISTCPEPKPCPPMPQCPSTLITPMPDPCNPDPNEPDLTKLKKLQHKFQQDDGVPIYLKNGKFDIFLYQLSVVLTVVSCISAIIGSVNMSLK